MKVTAILGTYHKVGIIDSAVDEILAAAAKEGAEVRKVHLLDQQVKFCNNCQACTQTPGPTRGPCPIQDDLPALLDALDASDAIVLASPMNVWTVTALMKAFIERLACYAYWPWDQLVPRERIKHKTKRAVVVASSSAPGLIARRLTGMAKLLKGAARLLGAGKVDVLFIGLARHTPNATLNPRARARAAKLGHKLVR